MGGRLGQRITPLQRVGVYVPGGTAPLPSSLLMSVIPAQVAGVQEIAVATPPGQNGGKVADVILAAASIAGIDTIYTLGGAQAIAAMAPPCKPPKGPSAYSDGINEPSSCFENMLITANADKLKVC